MKTPIPSSSTAQHVISEEARQRAQAELNNRTGDTDSDDEQLEVEGPT